MIISIICLSGFASSCVEDDMKPCYSEDGLYTLSIEISAIGTRGAESYPAERIKSFRIIMTHNDTIELNRKITPESLAYDFNYYFIWHTPAGKKKFYLLANEESVGDLNFSENDFSNLEKDITKLLDSYQPGTPAPNIKKILFDSYFRPKYDINNNEIFLPYSSFYDEIEVKDDLASKNIKMYVVPVATKFTFNFINYRQTEVQIKGISMSYANTENYLYASVGEKDMYKTLSDEPTPLYWVDWLAKIGEMSQEEFNQGYDNIVDFNKKYGWIADYKIPTPSIYDKKVFVGQDSKFDVPKGEVKEETSENEIIPGVYKAGPYYVPESSNCHAPDNDDLLEGQAYYLTIEFQDPDEENEAPIFENVKIGNLLSLFRNTNVIIDIEMSQGDVKIFAETADWNVKSINGWVTEGKEPSLK